MRLENNARSHYLKAVFSQNDQVLEAIYKEAERANLKHMQINAYEGGIIQFLCRALKVKKAVEIGTLFGYSTLMIARALPEMEGKLFTLDIDENRQKKAEKLLSLDHPAIQKIEFFPGRAMDTLQVLEQKGPFDMVFIDADKGAYLDYLHWSNKNLKSGGLLIADNSFLFGSVYGESTREALDSKTVKVMKEFNREVSQGGLYFSTCIPTEEGLTIGIRK